MQAQIEVTKREGCAVKQLFSMPQTFAFQIVMQQGCVSFYTPLPPPQHAGDITLDSPIALHS